MTGIRALSRTRVFTWRRFFFPPSQKNWEDAAWQSSIRQRWRPYAGHYRQRWQPRNNRRRSGYSQLAKLGYGHSIQFVSKGKDVLNHNAVYFRQLWPLHGWSLFYCKGYLVVWLEIWTSSFLPLFGYCVQDMIHILNLLSGQEDYLST